MNVELPNGVVIEGVPEGTSRDQIRQRAISSGLATEADFGPPSAQQPPTPQDFGPVDESGAPAPAQSGFQEPLGERLRTNIGEAFEGTLAGQVGLNIQQGANYYGQEARNLKQILDVMDQQGLEVAPQSIPNPAQGEGEPGPLGLDMPGVGTGDYAGRSRQELRSEYDALLQRVQEEEQAFDEQRQPTLDRRAEFTPWYEEEGLGRQIMAGGTSLAGQLLGGTPSPENLLAFGRGATVASRAGRGAAGGASASAAVEPMVQSSAIERGEREAFSPQDAALNVGLSAIIGGVLNVTPDMVRGVRNAVSQRLNKPPEQVTPDDLQQFDPAELLETARRASDEARLEPGEVAGVVASQTGIDANPPLPVGRGDAGQQRRDLEQSLARLFDDTDVLRRDAVDVDPAAQTVTPREGEAPLRDPTGEQAAPETYGARNAVAQAAEEMGVTLDEAGIRNAARDIADDPSADVRTIVRDYSVEGREQAIRVADARRQRRQDDLWRSLQDEPIQPDFRSGAGREADLTPRMRQELEEARRRRPEGVGTQDPGTPRDSVDRISTQAVGGLQGQFQPGARPDSPTGQSPIPPRQGQTVDSTATDTTGQRGLETGQTVFGDAPPQDAQPAARRDVTQDPAVQGAVLRRQDDMQAQTAARRPVPEQEPPAAQPRGEAGPEQVGPREQAAREISDDLSSALSVFPSMQRAENGLIDLRGFTPQERAALRDAGLTQTRALEEGGSLEGVAPDDLWPLRDQQADQLRQQRASQPEDTQSRDQGAERRARFYDRMADEEQALGDLADSATIADLRARAEEARSRKSGSQERAGAQADTAGRGQPEADPTGQAQADQSTTAGQEEGFTAREEDPQVRGDEEPIRATEEDPQVTDSPEAEAMRAEGDDWVQANEAVRENNQAEAQGRGDDPYTETDRPSQANADYTPDSTFYGGIPLDRLAAAIKRVTGDYAGTWRDQFSQNARFISALRETFRRPRDSYTNPWVQAHRAVFASSSDRLRRLSKDLDNPTLKSLAEAFELTSGTGSGSGRNTYHTRVDRRLNRTVRDVDRIAKEAQDAGLRMNDAQITQLRRLLENPGARRRGAIGQLANRVQRFFEEQLEYAREAGLDIGEVSGYMPRVVNRERLYGNDKGRFVTAASRAYQIDNPNLSAAEAQNLGELRWQREMYGQENANPGETGGFARAPGQAAPMKARSLSNRAIEESGMNDFLIQDPVELMLGYTSRITVRAELARTEIDLSTGETVQLGDNWSNWQQIADDISARNENSRIALPEIVDMTAVASGMRARTYHGKGAQVGSWMRTIAGMAMLEMATLTSLPEPLIGGMRASMGGTFRQSARDVATQLGNMGRYMQDATRVLTRLPKRERLEAYYDLAEDMGYLSGISVNATSIDRFGGGEPTSRAQANLMTKFFTGTRLEQFTNYTAVLGMETGNLFMRRLASDATVGGRRAENARFHLRDLNLRENEVDGFAQWMRDNGTDAPPTQQALEADPVNAERYFRALNTFVEQSRMNPNAATKPGYASNPLGALIFQLQAWPFAFTDRVLKRPFRQAMAQRSEMGNAAAVATFLPFITGMVGTGMFQYGQGLLRDELREVERGEEVRPQSQGARIERAVSYAGVTGKADPLIQTFTGVRYQRSPVETLVGPAGGQWADLMGNMSAFALNNTETTDTAERNLYRSTMRTIAEPAMQAALSLLPDKGLTGTALVGARMVGPSAVTERSSRALFPDDREQQMQYGLFESILGLDGETLGPRQSQRLDGRESTRSGGREGGR